jgi:Rrf2 family protein
MMISKTGIHATLALTFLADLADGEFAGAGAIAREIGAPQNYLGKLLNNLVGSGLVLSQKGYGGGFRLARPAERISVFDIVEPIDHISRWGNCFMGRGKCSESNPCAVHNDWKEIRERYLGFLKSTTLADLAGGKASLT